jgi:hypothetical protein
VGVVLSVLLVFCGAWVVDVVFWWCICGGLCGEAGQETECFFWDGGPMKGLLRGKMGGSGRACARCLHLRIEIWGTRFCGWFRLGGWLI